MSGQNILPGAGAVAVAASQSMSHLHAEDGTMGSVAPFPY